MRRDHPSQCVFDPKRFSASRVRTGSAVIELSVCLPIIFLIALATIEACSMIYLKQSLKIAAYESVRVGLVDSADQENVKAQVDLILQQRNVQAYLVTLNPQDPRTLQPGDLFRVTITAQSSENAILGSCFMQSDTLTEFVEAVKE